MMKNVPKLRFRGFDGEWEQYYLYQLVERVTRKNRVFRQRNC